MMVLFVTLSNGIRDNNIVLPIVAECYDGGLNDISGLHCYSGSTRLKPLKTRAGGPVAEGCVVWRGTGMRCYGFKAGIGTSSRVLPEDRGGWTVGVLVNSNGGQAVINCELMVSLSVARSLNRRRDRRETAHLLLLLLRMRR